MMTVVKLSADLFILPCENMRGALSFYSRVERIYIFSWDPILPSLLNRKATGLTILFEYASIALKDTFQLITDGRPFSDVLTCPCVQYLQWCLIG